MTHKKLVIFMPSIEGGGVEKNIIIVTNYLSNFIEKITLITFDKRFNNQFKKNKQNIKKSYYYLPVKKIESINEQIDDIENENDLYNIKHNIYENKWATEEDIEKINKKVKEMVSECEKFAEDSPYPEKSVMYDVVYDQENYPFLPHKL